METDVSGRGGWSPDGSWEAEGQRGQSQGVPSKSHHTLRQGGSTVHLLPPSNPLSFHFTYLLCVCMCTHMHMEGSEVKSQKSDALFHRVGPGNQTEVIRPGLKGLYPRSYLAVLSMTNLIMGRHSDEVRVLVIESLSLSHTVSIAVAEASPSAQTPLRGHISSKPAIPSGV